MAVGAFLFSSEPQRSHIKSSSGSSSVDNLVAAPLLHTAGEGSDGRGSTPLFEAVYAPLLTVLHSVVMWLITSIPPASHKPLRIKHAINFHKLSCPVAIVTMLVWFQCRELHAYVYLGIHGMYGLTWLIKDQTFPHASWETPASIPSFIALYALMALFWIAPYLVITANSVPEPEVTLASIVSYILGFFFLHVGDAQKYYTLRLKRGLMDDSMFARTRNPNYFGKLLIYSAFALLASASPYWYLPWCVNVLVWCVLFVPNWMNKDRRLSRHPGFTAYVDRSGLVLPWIWGDGWWGGDHGISTSRQSLQ